MKYSLKSYLALVMICFGVMAKAQYNEVLRASNWGGVTNVNWNPAIADNRLKFDMNLVTLGFGLSNNYIGLSNKPFLDKSKWSASNFQDLYLKERLNGRSKAIQQYTQIQGPLSFMVSWGKNRSNKNALAVSWNFNQVFNISGVSEVLARSSYWGLGYKADSLTGFNGDSLKNKNLSTRMMMWNDYGITYSRVVWEKGSHFLKAGGTLKILQGYTSAYLYSNNIDYKFENFDSLNIYNSDVHFGHDNNLSKVYNVNDGFNGSNLTALLKSKNISAAVDLGVIYEYRPKKDDYKYTMDCKEWWRTDVDKYLIQAGLSVVDLGAIRFNSASLGRDFNADIRNWKVKEEPIKDVHSFDSVLASKPGVTYNVAADKFTVWLPTRFNMFVDANIYKGLGANLSAQISPVMAKNRNQITYPSNVTLTPRYDHKWVGVYVPMTVDFNGNFGAGFGLRAGPLFVSSSNCITMVAKKWNYAFNIQAGVKITIPNGKIKDRDKDGVSNKLDKCKKSKGTCQSEGCADKDGDGVADEKDKCPDVAGIAELNGCPDSDKDGVIDIEDECPDVAGPKELKGCPDTDGDGILDKNDECPTEKGVAALNGCPDRDGDGVADKVDACPDVAGDKAHAGCPDTDGDGLYDNEDKCPREKGPRENMGCPWPDTDGDGVLDKDDECPKVKGLAENKGCPKLDKKEEATLNYAFKNLEFETGKDVIRTKSYASLNSLATLLKDKGYGLRIDGHTDNVGKPEMNMDLSRRRAEAVKKYLANKGANADKMVTNGYGDTKPIADNKTAEGRQRNRRVEMSIIF